MPAVLVARDVSREDGLEALDVPLVPCGLAIAVRIDGRIEPAEDRHSRRHLERQGLVARPAVGDVGVARCGDVDPDDVDSLLVLDLVGRLAERVFERLVCIRPGVARAISSADIAVYVKVQVLRISSSAHCVHQSQHEMNVPCHDH